MSSEGATRADPTSASRPDLLLLHGLRFFGHHGVSAAERRAGGEFTVDLDIEADLTRAMRTDAVEDTVNYVDLYAVVREIVEDGEFHLVEVMAARIAERLLLLPRVRRVQVRVTKPPRLPAQDRGFAVEIARPV
ncbi:MAG TPA: dihydroneopterin aldolase [Candidatus Dormibacteraeota bacterium]|nr:dihydroneopterin aldolase [Candidatus Dormibacteraeota bacterium]